MARRFNYRRLKIHFSYTIDKTDDLHRLRLRLHEEGLTSNSRRNTNA